MSNKLNQLLENAKDENPLLTENDIISVINNHSLLGKKQTFFTLKNILMMSVISSILVGLWIGFHPTATTNLAEPLQAPSPAINDSLERTPTADKLLASANNYRQPTTAKKAPAKTEPLQATNNFRHLPEVNKRQEAVLFETTPFTPLFNKNPIDDNRHYFDENGYLILSKEELAKLGIITDGNVLKYNTRTDTFFNFKENGISETKYTFFSVDVEKHGSRRTNNGFTSDSIKIKQSLPFWASALSILNFPTNLNSPNKKDSTHQLTESLFGFGYEKDFFNEIRPLLVPICVQLKAISGIYSSDLKLLFWFKAENAFYNALEPNVAKAVASKYGHSSIEDYKAILQKYRTLSKTVAFQKGFDSLTVAKLKHHFIELNREQLKNIGIKLSKKGFHFKSYQNIDNKTQKLDVRVKKHYTLIGNNDNLFQRKRKNTLFRAIAMSDVSIKRISYLMQLSDSISSSEQEELKPKYFRENIQKLIPIKVNADHVIWFEPTEELKRIVSSK